MRPFFRRAAWIAAAILTVAALAPEPATAQSDILLRLRSGSPAGDRFRVDSAGGFVALGNLGIGIVPATGCGERVVWYPYKSGFRAGSAGNGSGCTTWDDANYGFYSMAGGFANIASGIYSMAMGDGNEVRAQASAAFGSNIVIPNTGNFGFGTGYSTYCGGTGCVAMGYRASARANYTVALGNRVSTGTFTGAFVWGDGTTSIAAVDDSVLVTANNQFAIRASGGMRLFTNALASTGVTMNAGGSTWNAVSDRNRKENFAEVDGEDILRRLRLVPVSAWNYIAEGREVRHIGPMAQDWHAAFALNDDPLTINQGDFDGVNLAAVKALEERTRGLPALEAELARLREDNAALRTDAAEKDRRIQALEARLERLEAALGRVP